MRPHDASVVPAPGRLAQRAALLESLPGDVERCVLVDLEGTSTVERRLLEEGGGVQPFLWQLDVPLQAVAAVSRRAAGARAVAYALLTNASAQAVGDALRALGRYQVRVGGSPVACLPDECPIVVSAPRQGVVRLDLGLFLGANMLSESSRDCLGLSALPGSVLMASSERVMPTMGPAVGPLQVRIVARRVDEGISLQARDVYIDDEAAQEAFSLLPFHSVLNTAWGAEMGQTRREREGREVVSEQTLGATDLTWFAEDEALRERTRNYGVQLVRLQEGVDADPAQLPRQAVLRRLSEYRDLLSQSGHLTADHPAARQATTLRASALKRFPDDAEVAAASRALDSLLPTNSQAAAQSHPDASSLP